MDVVYELRERLRMFEWYVEILNNDFSQFLHFYGQINLEFNIGLHIL